MKNNRILYIDISTPESKTIDTIDNVDLSLYPIPHAGDYVNISLLGDDVKLYSGYKVHSVSYSYQHWNCSNPNSNDNSNAAYTFIRIYLTTNFEKD